MGVMVGLLRGVNVGGHNKIPMEALRGVCAGLGLEDAQTYVQSGNVVFRTKERDEGKLRKKIQDAIAKKFGFRPEVIVRTAAEMREVVARNPFAKRRGIEPGKLLVLFLAEEPGAEARKKVLEIKSNPEEMRMERREVYVYYPEGMGRSKLSSVAIEKKLGTAGTGRNWNSVRKLLEMAERMEAAG